MKLKVKFRDTSEKLPVNFGELHQISDGGYERGYASGYEVGHADGYSEGHTAGVQEGYTNGYQTGLAERQYEVWTITLVDGSVVEKEVALL